VDCPGQGAVRFSVCAAPVQFQGSIPLSMKRHGTVGSGWASRIVDFCARYGCRVGRLSSQKWFCGARRGPKDDARAPGIGSRSRVGGVVFAHRWLNRGTARLSGDGGHLVGRDMRLLPTVCVYKYLVGGRMRGRRTAEAVLIERMVLLRESSAFDPRSLGRGCFVLLAHVSLHPSRRDWPWASGGGAVSTHWKVEAGLPIVS